MDEQERERLLDNLAGFLLPKINQFIEESYIARGILGRIQQDPWVKEVILKFVAELETPEIAYTPEDIKMLKGLKISLE
jgi:hypothetical protein